ncbi:MAG TPA: glutamate dehydrogenase, partial [Kaistia sp.]|nr:glutamate dehydrogenase [Kaistia sp.]
AIQGFGNAGQHIASLLGADGYKIVAVSDSKGAIHNDAGLDVAKLLAAKKTGSVLQLAGSDGIAAIDADTITAVDCEILVPAALEDLIHKDNAAAIKARVILELANGPITPEADVILAEKNVVVLPDILANAGGVTVSYFEWVQNRQGYYWTAEEVRSRLQDTMDREGRAVWTLAQERGITVRSAAYVHALSRVAGAIEAHGTQKFFTS